MLIQNIENMFLSLIEDEIVGVFLKEGEKLNENKDSVEMCSL